MKNNWFKPHKLHRHSWLPCYNKLICLCMTALTLPMPKGCHLLNVVQQHQGPVQCKDIFLSMGISSLKIRQSWDHPIFIGIVEILNTGRTISWYWDSFQAEKRRPVLQTDNELPESNHNDLDQIKLNISVPSIMLNTLTQVTVFIRRIWKITVQTASKLLKLITRNVSSSFKHSLHQVAAALMYIIFHE